MHFDKLIKTMNRKNTSTQLPSHPTHITVQDIDNSPPFTSSQITLGSHHSKNFEHHPKWTFPLTLQKLQPYLMGIHTTLIKNLKRKLLERELTVQEEELIECSRHDKNLQQFISGILAIETCVQQLTKQHTSTIVTFTKATNLLLINYKSLYLEYIELKNTVRTSESLTNCEQVKTDGFLKFFDSLKFLALVIKNAFMETEERGEDFKEENTGSSLWDSWRYEMRKLQDLMSFESILSMDKSSVSGHNSKDLVHHHKMLDQKLVCMHNQQQEIIISQLQKENNFLRWQIFSKDNTITEYEESIYNVDLSEYRQNDEREEYWARRVKFNANGNCSNHNVNNYSQVLNDGSAISYRQGKSQMNIIEEKILEPSELQFNNDELTTHLNILSKKMEELEIENKTLRETLKKIEQVHNNHESQNGQSGDSDGFTGQFGSGTSHLGPQSSNLDVWTNSKPKERKYSQKYSDCSNNSLSERYEMEKQRLDLLIQEISDMKAMICELEEKEVEHKELLNEKNAEIVGLKDQIGELSAVIQQSNKSYLQVKQKCAILQNKNLTHLQKIQLLTQQLTAKCQQLSAVNQQLSIKSDDLSQKSLDLKSKTQQVLSLTQQLNTISTTLQTKQKQILSLTNDIGAMNEEFAKEMEKYNTVFYKISEELSACLQKSDSLQNQNINLLDKNQRLQEDNVRRQAIIINLQTKLACPDPFPASFSSNNFTANPNQFAHSFIPTHFSGNIPSKKSPQIPLNNGNPVKMQQTQHIFSRESRLVRKSSHTPLKEFEHPHEVNRMQQFAHINEFNKMNELHKMQQQTEHPEIASQTIHNHNHYHHHTKGQSLTPSKRIPQRKDEQRTEERSKSPIDARDLSRKKITIKVEGNKLVNEIIDNKQAPSHPPININSNAASNRKSQLLMRAHRLINDKQNQASPPSSKQKNKRNPSPRRQSQSPDFKMAVK